MLEFNFDLVAQKAMDWAKKNYPSSSIQHRTAFANSVTYLVTGMSGGYSGPSLREHLVSWSLGKVGAAALPDGTAITTVTPNPQLPSPGNWEFEAACAHAALWCFTRPEELGNVLLQVWEREHSFDNDPADLELIRGKARRAR